MHNGIITHAADRSTVVPQTGNASVEISIATSFPTRKPEEPERQTRLRQYPREV